MRRSTIRIRPPRIAVGALLTTMLPVMAAPMPLSATPMAATSVSAAATPAQASTTAQAPNSPAISAKHRRPSPVSAAAARARKLNGGGRVLSVRETTTGYYVKLIKQGEVRIVVIPRH